jgi:S1-C subfamily serine protease
MEGEIMNTETWRDLSTGLASAIEKVGPTIVAVNARPRVPTSGVLWRQGVIVSTHHTVRRNEDITVTMADGQTLPATLAGRDPGTDLAVLRITGAGPETAEIGDASSLKVGHLVLGVGRTYERRASASLGMVSSIGGAWRTWRGGELDQLIRLDLAIYLGFSGGPLVNSSGQVVGINTSGLARGAGLTIPASTVNRVVDALLERGSVARGYMGASMQPVALPEKLRASLSLQADSGLLVLSVEPDGPADKGGLMIGDVLIAIDGSTVQDTDDVQAALKGDRIGKAGQTLEVANPDRCCYLKLAGRRDD